VNSHRVTRGACPAQGLVSPQVAAPTSTSITSQGGWQATACHDRPLRGKSPAVMASR
jgi:hypothetical protein